MMTTNQRIESALLKAKAYSDKGDSVRAASWTRFANSLKSKQTAQEASATHLKGFSEDGMAIFRLDFSL